MKIGQLIALIFLFTVLNSSAQDMNTVVQSGHYGPILCLDFSPDGKLMVTGGKDQTIRLWEVSTGRELRTYKAHEKSVRTIRFRSDGQRFVSVGHDKRAILWDVLSEDFLKEWTDSSDVIRTAVFSPDGTQLITGGHKVNATIWDLETGKRLQIFKTKPEVCYQCVPDVLMSQDGKYLYSGAADRTTLIWDVQKADTIKAIKLNKGQCSSCNTYVDLSPDGKTLVKADYRGGLYLLNAKTGKLLKTLAEDEEFYGVQYHSSGRYILGHVDYNGAIKVWDVNNGKVVMDHDPKENFNIGKFSPNGQFISTAGEDHVVWLRHFPSGKLIRTFEGIVTKIPEEGLNSSELYYLNLITDTELSPDGKYVAQCKKDSTALIWDFTSGRILKKFYGHHGVVTTLAFSPDSKTLATGGTDRTIKLWNVASGEMIQSIDAHGAMVLDVKFSANGKQLISGSWDGWFKVWNMQDGTFISEGKKHEGSPYSVDLTPNSIYAVSGGLDKKLLLTELDSRETFIELKGHTDVVQSMAFHPKDGRLLTGGWDGVARIWNTSNGYQEKKFSEHKGPVYAVAFNASGDHFVTGCEDKLVRLYETETGKLIRSFEGHKGGVNYVAFTANGKQLLTASRDKSVKVWDLESGSLLYTHITLNANHWMAMNPEGQFEGSPEATKKLFFVKGNRSYSLDQFFEQFYHPGVVQNALAARGRDMPKQPVADLLKSSPPPSIKVLSPMDGDTMRLDRAELIIQVENTGGDINEVRLLHNNKHIPLPDRLQRTPREGQDMTITYSVQLLPGQNELSISAFSNGRVESTPQKINLHYGGTPKNAKLYLLVIGINEYKNPLLSLNYASADAKSFAKAMEKNSKALFDEVDLTLLLDEKATKENILNSLDELIQKAKKEDVLYLYYAGHGGMGNQDFFFIPTECVSLYQEDRLNESAIPAELLNEKLRQIQALKQVVVLDACHSGASTQVLASRGLPEEKALAQLARSSGIHILAASGSEQQAVEFTQLGHGVFTYVLLEALDGKADGAPKDNKVTVYELKSYLDDQVPEQSRAYQGSTQYPSTFSLGQDFPLILIDPAK